MDKSTRIHLTKKLEVAELDGDKAMIDFETGKYFLLKGAANEIWDIIQEDTKVEDIVLNLRAQYDVSEDECLGATISFLENLKKLGFIEAKQDKDKNKTPAILQRSYFILIVIYTCPIFTSLKLICFISQIYLIRGSSIKNLLPTPNSLSQ